jgi:uncharacterized membrane protein
MTSAMWHRATVASVAAVILFSLLWETWLAPVRPGGSWLVLKVLPLCLLWVALVQRRFRAFQWLLLLLPWYFAEGVVRGFSETGRHSICAYAAAALSLVAIGAGLGYVRAMKRGYGAAFIRKSTRA